MAALEVRPGSGIGPFGLGSTRGVVKQAAKKAGLLASPFRRTSEGPEGLQVAGQIFIYFDLTDRVDEIEVALDGLYAVRWQGLDLGGPARDVSAAFDAVASPDSTDAEYPATTRYPMIGLSLWQDAKPGRPLTGAFEAVLVRRPDGIAAR